MRSKLTKTIFTIVFVVFLGLVKANDVSAVDYFAQCYYSNESVDAVVGIQYNFSFADIVYRSDMATNEYDEIMNWAKNAYSVDYTGYNGYDDSWYNNKCPDYLILGERNVAYFSDEEHADIIIDWLNDTIAGGWRFTWHKIPLVGHTYQDAENGYYVSYMKCVCQGGENTVKYEIAEDRELTLPSIMYNNAKRDAGYWYSYGLPYVVSANTCPERLFRKGSSYYFSSASDEQVIESKLVSGYTEMTCQVASDTPTQERVTKPEYNPPTVNTNIIKPLKSNSKNYSCGNGYITDIPSGIVRVINVFYVILQILVPIALVILGILDLTKAVTSQKEDEIKRGQQTFVKRMIAAVIIFFVFILVKLVVSVFSNDDNEVISCMNCFLQGEDNCEVDI